MLIILSSTTAFLLMSIALGLGCAFGKAPIKGSCSGRTNQPCPANCNNRNSAGQCEKRK